MSDDNEPEEHILIKDNISQIFPNTNVHAISIDYDETPSNKHSILKRTMGVSQHINFNAEKFRYRKLAEAVNRLVIKTDQAVEKIDIKALLECNFSTTSNISLTASRIVLLDTVKAYFSYKIYFRCGIPKVTLEGTLEDWVKLQEKIIQLRQLDLDMDFWLDKLEPVVWKLVETYKGEIDDEFWTKIVSLKYSFGSGANCRLNGWITAFYPYKKDGTKSILEPEDIPDGRVEVPFTTNTGLRLKFIAGFLGARQKTLENTNELVVSPIIGWFVIDNNTTEKDNAKPKDL
ncbi:hypothetical protein C1645_882176 [Glomus cerebriforme]|uniref:Uncharacterized protein n=1 Tax=Glomus cerebriforme TaxID=658196 RepID=A0A397S368_9GLOM|nr:hypothetical protein C1645_882176 [Glomus cerebriforme]